MHLELTDEQAEGWSENYPRSSTATVIPSVPPYRGAEGDPWAVMAGARARAPAPTTALRAAEQGKA